jgi:hypothetical protein
MCAVRRDLQVFLDIEELRAGERWKEGLVREIDNRDALFLFWSRNAKASEWVDFEWRHAYATKGLEGIQPVPVEPAFLCPPPDELKDMHFSDSLHYVIYAPEGW